MCRRGSVLSGCWCVILVLRRSRRCVRARKVLGRRRRGGGGRRLGLKCRLE